ncbi:DnaJ domain-containing protein [bacterium]|nr:DnaJ domain-containing protein [bacterium]
MTRLERSRWLSLLGLGPDATEVDIRKAYRRLVRQWHPDVNPDPAARDQFLLVQKAYERLQSGAAVAEQEAVDPVVEAHILRRERLRKAYLEKRRLEEEKRLKALRRWWFFPFALMLLPWGVHLGQRGYNRWQVLSKPDTTWCSVHWVGYREVHYAYEVGGEEFFGHERTGKVDHSMIGGNGMPLKEGDVFQLLYRADRPRWSLVNYAVCGGATFDRYLGLCESQLLEELDSTWSEHPHHVRCMALLIFEHYGINGLADVVFKDTSPFDNWAHNRWTFVQRSRTRRFKIDERLCAPGD